MKGKAAEPKFYFFLVFLAGLFSYLLVTPKDFPFLGLGLFLAILATLVFYLKRVKNQYSWIMYFLILAFSFFLFYRSDEVLSFLNFAAIILLGSILILEPDLKYSILSTMTSPFRAILGSLGIKSKYELDLTLLSSRLKNVNLSEHVNHFKSILLSLVLVLIIVPLLSYSNPIFADLVARSIKFLNLATLLEKFFNALSINLMRIPVFLIFAIFLPQMATFASLKKESISQNLPAIFESLLIPKIVVAGILIVFFVAQAELYFATKDTLLSMGVTNSEYAREVFAHLSIVSLIIFGLIYNEKKDSKWSRLLTYILLIEAVFLNFIAFKSDLDYSLNWGFTFKRLYGFAAVAWFFGAIGLYASNFYKKESREIFARNIIVYSGLILVAINIVNFDYLIFHYRKSTTHSGIDHFYLSRLSPDSGSYEVQFKELIANVEKKRSGNMNEAKMDKVFAARNLLYRISALQEKYKKVDWQGIRYLEYKEYEKIININVKKYLRILDSIQPSPEIRIY